MRMYVCIYKGPKGEKKILNEIPEQQANSYPSSSISVALHVSQPELEHQ